MKVNLLHLAFGFLVALFVFPSCGTSDETKAKLAEAEEAYWDVQDDLRCNLYRITLMRNIPAYQQFIPNDANHYYGELLKTAAASEASIQTARESWDDEEVLNIVGQLNALVADLNQKDSLYLAGIAKKIDGAGVSKGLQYQFILEDSKAEYFATLARTSWDESTDANTDADYTYKERPVDEATYLEFSAFDAVDKPLAEAYSSGFMERKIGYRNFFSERYKAISDNYPLTESWPNDRSDACEIWVSDTRAKCWQKFAIEINGQTHHTDWIQVPEEAYETTKDGLGMAVYAKTASQKEADALIVLTPPNMQYVGNDQYGQWGSDNTWQWYDGADLCRDFIDAFDRVNYQLYAESYRPYGYDFYGADASGNRRFGLNSAHTSSFKSTTYVQNHPQSLSPAKTTVPAKPVGNIRTAGRSARGGGPGGGGK